MSDERKPVWPWIVALLIGMPMMYVGAYACTVERLPVSCRSQRAVSRRPCYYVPLPFGASLYGNETDWGRVFHPVHSADRQLRPKYWNFRINPR